MSTENQKKTTRVFTRVTPDLKSQAEAVLNQLQIPMSTALTTDQLSEAQFDHEIQKGLDDFNRGHTHTAKQIRHEFNSHE